MALGSDVLVLAVKPQVLPSVLGQLEGALDGRLVVSIAAGVKLATLEGALAGARVVRVMPNLPLQVLSGATAVCPGSSRAEDGKLVQALFAALGSAQVMTEAQLDVAGAISGCGPAFFALFVDDLTRTGVRAGLPAAACREMVLATMRGVAQQLLESGEHPRAYMEKVTSPGGTTAAALEAMEPRCSMHERGRRRGARAHARAGGGIDMRLMFVLYRLIDFYELLILAECILSWFPVGGIVGDIYEALRASSTPSSTSSGGSSPVLAAACVGLLADDCNHRS